MSCHTATRTRIVRLYDTTCSVPKSWRRSLGGGGALLNLLPLPPSSWRSPLGGQTPPQQVALALGGVRPPRVVLGASCWGALRVQSQTLKTHSGHRWHLENGCIPIARAKYEISPSRFMSTLKFTARRAHLTPARFYTVDTFVYYYAFMIMSHEIYKSNVPTGRRGVDFWVSVSPPVRRRPQAA